MKNIEELKAEAKNLGITFSPNIGVEKLSQKIEDYYESQAAGDFVQVKPESDEVENKSQSTKSNLQKRIAEAKKKAFAKKIVTISSNDKRDSEYTTTAYLSVENQHFGISKLIPLDIPVELEDCLISVAKNTFITLHKDEIIDGRRTGNKIPVSVRKYNVSYEEIN